MFSEKFGIISPQKHGSLKGKNINAAMYELDVTGIFADHLKSFDLDDHKNLLSRIFYSVRGNALLLLNHIYLIRNKKLCLRHMGQSLFARYE